MESLDHIYVWVRAAKHAPRCWCYIIERRHGLAEIVERTARRVLGGAHPYVDVIETFHRESRDKLRAREMSARGASSPARRRGACVPSVPSPGSGGRGGGVPMTARDAVAIASQYAND